MGDKGDLSRRDRASTVWKVQYCCWVRSDCVRVWGWGCKHGDQVEATAVIYISKDRLTVVEIRRRKRILNVSGRTKTVSNGQGEGWRPGFWLSETAKKRWSYWDEGRTRNRCEEADKEFSFRHVKFKMFIRTLVLLFIS